MGMDCCYTVLFIIISQIQDCSLLYTSNWDCGHALQVKHSLKTEYNDGSSPKCLQCKSRETEIRQHQNNISHPFNLTPHAKILTSQAATTFQWVFMQWLAMTAQCNRYTSTINHSMPLCKLFVITCCFPAASGCSQLQIQEIFTLISSTQ